MKAAMRNGLELGVARGYGRVVRGVENVKAEIPDGHPKKVKGQPIPFSNNRRTKISNFHLLDKKSKYLIKKMAREQGLILNNRGKFRLGEILEVIIKFTVQVKRTLDIEVKISMPE